MAFLVLWVTWGLIWLLAAPWAATTRNRQRGLPQLMHRIPILLGGALFFFNPSADQWLGRTIIPRLPWIPWLGLGMTLAGLLFAVWARVALGKMWSGWITLKEDHVLVRRGPYALARHPIYTGLLLAILGGTLARGTVNYLLGFVLVAIALVIKLRHEEQLMTATFGPAYEDYRSHVKAIIPFIL